MTEEGRFGQPLAVKLFAWWLWWRKVERIMGMGRLKPLDEGGLFDHARARNTDPATSHMAAASVKPKLREKQADVLKVLREIGPACDTKLLAEYQVRVKACEVSEQSASGLRTRRKELVSAGKVRAMDRRDRLPSGRLSIVWEVVDSHDE
jgi:hypothetical protein